ncbi:Pimeloyl-ACP methyl ester carboxylesterase [Methylobacterium phyllostachyos]|uniref:Pimeloyl-ACP methyl ester carboxylesterase n=1 Tax=Methylobacterium phyllostachyos TaxID=582672 RepID=A0A1H0GF44_9HYPH|nr:alpha/beta hydrolase [Methylobacterium phyllostachyos]SDO05421.1 Pimeloyl-ACP methyl ester carboxylesterase [Methylobacterium phyllostachyos]
MKSVRAGVLEVAYREAGPPDGPPAVLLHGFPYDIHAYDVAAERLAAAGVRCLIPYLRGYGPTRFLDAATPRSGEQAALGADLLAFLDALGIGRAVLAGYDWGGRAACVVAALWPERAKGLVSCGVGYNIQNIPVAGRPAAPEVEHRLWYQYYLHGERGRAGLEANRDAFCRLLWQLWSPSWGFDDGTFAQTAGSFDNPDFVDVVVHSYRHRFGLVPSDPAYLEIEARLAEQPAIAVPSIVLLGADDGVGPPPASDTAARHFTGPYRREIVAGVGHNFPQEAPDAFATAVRALL